MTTYAQKIVCRRSVEKDAEAVVELLRTSVLHLAPGTYSQAVIDTWMVGVSVDDFQSECSNAQLWIAERETTPVGFSQAIPGEIVRLFVDSSCVGQGIGSALMNHALKDAVPFGAGTAKIVALLNAVDFYKKWGFRELERSVLPGREASLPSIDIVNMSKVF